MIVWGVSAGHDAALAVIRDGEIKFASQSERYSGCKNDGALNTSLINNALLFGYPDLVVWHENPYKKMWRLLKTGQDFTWSENSIKSMVKDFTISSKTTFVGHHKSHAAGGYYTSNFDEAAILVIDAIGEFDTITFWRGIGDDLKEIESIEYPHSLGLFYSAMTQFLGYKPNEEEYIVMGMAAYGRPMPKCYLMMDRLMSHGHAFGLKHNLHRGINNLLPPPQSDQDKCDYAAATQMVYEIYFERLVKEIKEKTGSDNLVISGGCALNCVANNLAKKHFDNVWIMPNPGDSGNALGAALAHHGKKVKWEGPYLGYEIYGEYPVDSILKSLEKDQIVGVANGRAEFGPRALGNRSLLADPRGGDIKDRVNQIKKRQRFRPFAPAILEDVAEEYFEGIFRSPYMQFTFDLLKKEEFPAIMHVDGSSRVQTVNKEDNPGFYTLLKTYYEKTGCPMLLNTSLNIRGKPMVNNKLDAEQFHIKYGIKVHK